METLAGITLYEPDVQRLLENIEAVVSQVDKLICVDNGSKNINEIKKQVKCKYPEIDIIENGENLGIAKALNQMFSYAEEKGYGWVLTLDQDSVCPDNLMEEYSKYMHLNGVGILSPKLTDRNYHEANPTAVEREMEKKQTKITATEKIEAETPQQNENRTGDKELVGFEYVDKCITSASLTSVETWKRVGGFWEYLFIDFVDHDFCAKCVKKDIKILRVNSVELLHELGNGEHHTFLGRRVTALNHSPFRKYYMVRNWLIYMKVHREVIDYKKERNSYRFFYLKTMLFEKQKLQKLVQMLKGRRDGKKFKMV